MITHEQEAKLRELAEKLTTDTTLKQGYGALRMQDPETKTIHMCCLGVACDMIQPMWKTERTTMWGTEDPSDGVSARTERGSDTYANAFFWADTIEVAELTDDAQEVFGINRVGSFWLSEDADDAPEAMMEANKHARASLAEMNDHYADFAGIAATILYILDHPDTARFYEPHVYGYPYGNPPPHPYEER